MANDSALRTARRLKLDVQRTQRLIALIDSVPTGTHVRLNQNRRTLLSMRGQRHGGWTVSLHVGLLDHPAAILDLPIWIASKGRTSSLVLRRTLRVVWDELQRSHPGNVVAESGSPALKLEPLGSSLDLESALGHIHRTWFPLLPRPAIGWGKASHRQLTHIRFGSYRRLPVPLIRIHPRLNQPWIARAFIEHVLFHEFCHHAQACAPLRGERPHSPRFRAWERSYPHHDLAMTWERQNVTRLLSASWI